MTGNVAMIEIDHTIMTGLVDEYISDGIRQTLTIVPNEELKIIVTIPHDVFEWYVDVFDRNGSKVHTNWLDHYGDAEINLRVEMKKSIEDFIVAVTKYPMRLIVNVKPELSSLEIYRDDLWSDIFY